MRLQSKIFLALISVSIGTLVLHWALTRSTFFTGMDNIHKEMADSSLKRVIMAMMEEEDDLAAFCSTLAADPGWSAFLGKGDDSKLVEKLDWSFFDNNEVNLILLYDQNRQLVARAGFQRADKRPLEMADIFLDENPVKDPLLTLKRPDGKKTGLLVTKIDPLIYTGQPILCEKEICGYLVLGRFIDQEQEVFFSRIVDADFRMIQKTEPLPENLPDDIWSYTPPNAPYFLAEEDPQIIRAYHSIPTPNHNSSVLLETSTKNPFWSQNHSKISSFLIVAVVIGLIGLVVFIFFFQQVVVRPIKILTRQVLKVGDSPDHVMIEGLDRHDEIGVLASEFNRLLGRLRKRSHQEANISELDSLLAACNSIDEAAEVFKRIAKNLFPNTTGALYVSTSSSQVFELVVNWNGEWTDKSVYSFSDCWALRRGRLHTMNPGGNSPLCGHVTGDISSSQICLPLMAQGETMGTLHFKMIGDGAMDENRINLAENLAQHTSLAVANLKLRERLHNQAVRDPLTGLYNRRYLEESLERELSRARREQADLTVMMMDIDHFKKFNDTHGHEAGDYVLKQLGLTLAHFIRREDIACRYGGEEFTLILPSTDRQTGMARANSLCEQVRSIHLRFNARELGQVTLSIGVAVYPEHGESGEGLLAAADGALYKAKADGRDRAVMVGENSG